MDNGTKLTFCEILRKDELTHGRPEYVQTEAVFADSAQATLCAAAARDGKEGGFPAKGGAGQVLVAPTRQLRRSRR